MAVLGGNTSAGSPDDASYTFKVEAPAVRVSPSPEGGSRILLDGYVVPPTAAGRPELPLKTFRVALPPGATPRLEIRSLAEDLLRGVKPRPAPRRLHDLAAEDLPDANRDAFRRDVRTTERFEEDAEAYAARVVAPPAVLGEVGIFRDQRYVEVRVTPVRWDAAARGVRVARSFEVVVHFDGDETVRTAPVTDDRFEDVYRDAFVNYAQGTTFRMAETAPAVAAATTDAPSGPTTKIKIRANGVVRLDATRMAGSGIETQPLSNWVVLNRGVEVPLHVNDVNGNNLLDASDWVQFYGKALDDEAKTALDYDVPGTDIDIFRHTDVTDENIYFVYAAAGTHARMATLDGAPTNLRTPPADFEAVAHQEVDSADGWRPLGAADPWYWTPTLTSGGSASRTVSVPLPGLASGTAAARVLAKIRGVTENASLFPDHKTRVTLQNASSQTLLANDDDGTFDGRVLYTHDFAWPGTPGTLTSPANVLIEARAVTTGTHQVILDWVEVRYRRTFQASSDALTFSWPDGDAEFVVSGLSSSSPSVYEITTPGSPVRLLNGAVSGAGTFSVRFRVDNDPNLADGTARRFVVFGSGAVAVPSGADFASDTASDLRNTSIQADIIVIAHPTVLGASSQATLTQLLNWRLANQGLTSKIAWIQDVYDEFDGGIAGPQAIRNFLAWVMSTAPGEGWSGRKPSYVMLIGDGSYDTKVGSTNGNFVPTQIFFKDDPSFGYYASDNDLASVVGNDKLPDLTIGRISARTDAEANGVLTKLLNYQQSPPAGAWRQNALVISDRGKNYNVNEADEFELSNSQALAFMKTPPHTSQNLRYWSDYCLGTASGCTPAKANSLRADIKAAVNGGTSIVQFAGHGNFDVWSDDAFFDNRVPALDTDDLVNAGRQPLLFVHNCLSAGFMSTATRSLGEDWQKKADGGAIAVYSPSGLSNGYFGETASDIIWNDFFGNHKERILAIPVLRNWIDLCGVGAIEACQGYVLLGDPATRAIFPSVNPATNVVANGGNAQVSLTWTASTTGSVTYDVYRATTANGAYVKAGSSASTNFTDTGRTNATTYYYYVVALDASGFESRWSNFNSDCAVSGPDCVKATPLNPNPPAAPTGLVVTDPESGSKLNLSWNANAESDLSYYTIRYGTSPGVYTQSVNNARNTTASLTGLQNGVTYFIAITATNTSNNTSGNSVEQSGTPTFVRGIRSPDFISTLRIDKSASNAVLTWQAVTTDIYGKPATISKYEVFRATVADFVPGPANKIGETVTPSFTDTNALAGAAPNYHWLVRAVDASGNVGGAGYQLPNGIDALQISKSGTTPGNLVLSWPAVTTDFDGNPTRIASYEVYARSTPFRRSEIGTLTPIATIPGTTLELTPPAGTQYYSVVVVDTHGNRSSF
jgi:hypothetical protein